MAQDLLVYSKRIRMYECDAFTREYLTSEGIEVNPNETAPPDTFAQSRTGTIYNVIFLMIYIFSRS